MSLLTSDDPSTVVVALRVGVLAGALLVVVLLAWFRGRAVRDWWRRRSRSERLVSDARGGAEVEASTEARRAVLALAEAIEREPLDEHDDLAAWRRVLDCHDAARKALDAGHPREAIELSAAGRAHLARTRRS